MAVLKKENKIKKWEQRILAVMETNPEMAKKLEGKLAAFKGRKEQ